VGAGILTIKKDYLSKYVGHTSGVLLSFILMSNLNLFLSVPLFYNTQLERKIVPPDGKTVMARYSESYNVCFYHNHITTALHLDNLELEETEST
jgi:hypothetical protein